MLRDSIWMEVNVYILERDNHKQYSSFWSKLVSFSKDEKIASAEALLRHINNGTEIEEKYLPALREGKLGRFSA